MTVGAGAGGGGWRRTVHADRGGAEVVVDEEGVRLDIRREVRGLTHGAEQLAALRLCAATDPHLGADERSRSPRCALQAGSQRTSVLSDTRVAVKADISSIMKMSCASLNSQGRRNLAGVGPLYCEQYGSFASARRRPRGVIVGGRPREGARAHLGHRREIVGAFALVARRVRQRPQQREAHAANWTFLLQVCCSR